MPEIPAFEGRLRVPVIAAPMFLVSGPDLVVAACNSGIIGTFPALNQRTTEGYDAWLGEIAERLDDDAAPFGVNLIVHRSNPRLQADLEVSARHRVPLVITSLGAVADVVDAVHGWGGVVFHDVTTVRHAQKAAEAGVDGLILVCSGAGGHAGSVNPFALLPEIRRHFDGTIILAGSIGDGRSVAAARVLGADYAYMGTRFIATRESMASDEYRQMLVDAGSKDIVYTPAISGVPANFLAPSLVQAGLDPKALGETPDIDFGKELDVDSKAWKDIWSAGHGVATIDDVPSVADLVDRITAEWQAAGAP
jgi:nitronate monooxygenase